MTEKQIANEENKNITHKNEIHDQEVDSHNTEQTALANFQQKIGNRAVQRLLAQRSGDGPTSASLSAGFDLDDETTNRINRERGNGHSLDSNIQAKMSESTGQDFSGVKVHTGPESHALNESINATAFTTGQDIFFREGAYDPGSSSGQELLAHELTHVVQQSSGRVGGGSGRMTVNVPGDAYEQQADSVAKAVTSTAAGPSVQRQEMPVTEEDDEEEKSKAIQREVMPEDKDDEERNE